MPEVMRSEGEYSHVTALISHKSHEVLQKFYILQPVSIKEHVWRAVTLYDRIVRVETEERRLRASNGDELKTITPYRALPGITDVLPPVSLNVLLPEQSAAALSFIEAVEGHPAQTVLDNAIEQYGAIMEDAALGWEIIFEPVGRHELISRLLLNSV